MKKSFLLCLLMAFFASWVTVQAQKSLPYSYGFESDLAAEGWTADNQSSGNASKFGVVADAKHEGSYGFRFSSYSSSSDGYNQYLISPELSAANGVIVQFYYKVYSSAETFTVGYSTTTADLSSFTWGTEISATNTSWKLSDEFNFPAGTKYVALHYYSNYQYYLYVDDFTFSAPPSCPKPTGLAASNILSSAADLNWTENGTATTWQICVNGDESNLINVTAKPYTLDGLIPSTAYSVKVRAYCSGSDQSEWSNVINFTTDVSCPKPKNLALSGDPDTDEALIVWGAVAGAEGYDLEYSTSSDFTNPQAPSLIEEEYGLLEGLTPGTTYYVRVRALCGGEDNSEWSSVFSFRTPAIPTVVGDAWSEDFEETGESCGWQLINGTITNAWAWGTATNNGGTHALYVSNDAGTTNAYTNNSAAMVYATKLLTFAEGKYEFSYDWKANGESNYDYLRVALVPASVELVAGTSTPSGFSYYGLPTGWIALDGGSQLQGSNAWQNKSVVIDIAEAENYNYYLVVAWRNDGSGGSQVPAAVDNFSITKIACEHVVAGLASADITTATANISWTAGEASQWQVAYSQNSGFPTESTELSIVNEATKALSGLTPASTYYVRVRAYCGGEDFGAWSNAISFDTKCEAVSALDEDFDDITAGSGVLPKCWKRINNGSYSTSYPYVTADGYSTYSHSAANSLQFYVYGSSSYADQYAVLPEMSTISGKRISFYAKRYSTYTCSIKVGVMTDPEDASTFTQIGDDIPLTANHEKYTVNLSGTGNYIAFKVAKISSTYNGAYIDDIVVEDIPSCLEPSGLSFVSSTTNSATFAWTAGGTEAAWDIYYSTENVAPTAETAPLVIATAAKEIPSGLNHSTTYYVWVRAHCSDEDQSPWIGGISFRTACGVADAATWADDFEDGIYCWRMGNRQSALSNYKPYLYSGAAHDGEYGLYLRAYNANTVPADSSYAVLPEMNYGEKSLKDFTLSFYARSTYNNVDAYNQHLLIGVVEDPADSLATFVQVADVEVTDKYDLYEVSLANYTGAGQHIVLLATVPANYTGESATQFGHFYVDDIALVETPACQALRKITISDVERRSMVVNLVPKINVELGTYDLVCSTTKLDDAALEAAEKINVSAASYEINGLDRETKYYIYVRANCGSTWVCDSATTKALTYCEDLSIGTGTSYDKTPYTSWDYAYTQMIYPASQLQAGSISSLKFQRYAGVNTMNDIKVFIGTTEKASFTSTTDWIAAEDLTLVFDGSVPGASSAGYDEFTFSAPFAYDGLSNLVIAVSNGHGAWSEAHQYYYSTSTGAVLTRRADSDASYAEYPGTAAGQSPSGNLPNAVFVFCHDLPACPAVTELTASVLGTGTTQEKISWTISDADYLSGFDMIVSTTELDAEALATAEITYANIQGNSKDLEGLTPATPYYVYLRAICKAESHDEGNSDWASVEFTTLANCPAVINLALSLGATDSITAVWERATLEQEKTFRYILSTSRLDEDALEAATPTLVEDTVIAFAGLAHETKYYFYVASACGEQTSAYVEDSIVTLPACQAVENLTVVRTKHNLVELSWTSAQFASETQWEVGIVDDNNVHTQIVNERKAVIFGLTAETAYTAYVKAMCGEESTSAEATLAFTTEAQPGDCQQIGSGTATANYIPVGNYYNYSYSQQIFDASELQSGTITAISFQYAYATAMTKATNVTIYMGVTSKSTFSSTSDWVALSELTQVYQGTLNCSKGWNEFTLQTPFSYNGSGNLVIAVDDNVVKDYDGSSYTFNVTAGSANKTLYYQNDNNTSPASEPRTGTLSANRNNIQFCFEPKACPDVANMVVSDITTSSAKVTWDPMGSEMAWNVFISDHVVTDFTDVEAERVETVSKAFTGLLDDTDYFVYVQPANDCPTAEFNMVSFRTVASCLAPINAAVVSETITKHSARVTWVDPNETPAGSYTVAYAKVNDFDLTDPMIATVQVTDTFADLVALQADTIYKFAVMANCGSEDPSRYSAAAQFTTPQACFKPTNPGVVAESITSNSAVLYWKDEHHQGSYIIAYGLYNDFNINDPTTYELAYANDTFKLLNELQETTTYRFLVKSDCGEEGQSKDWSSYTHFTTTCGVKALPFSEDFENSTRFSYCWTKGNREYSSSTYYDPSRETSAKLNGEYGLKLYAYRSSSPYADSAYAVLPELNFGEEGISAYQMSFNAKSANTASSYYQHILIGVADDDELTNLEIVADKELTGEFAEYEVSFAAKAGNKRIVLLAIVDPAGTSGRYAQIYVDDIYVSHVSDCKRPNGLAVSEITDVAATLTWTENGEATAWQICLNGDEENLIAATENPFVLDELTAATAYTVKVRANCGGSQSEWSAEINFNTAICSPANMKSITYELTDQYSDTWNGASITIVHAATGVEVATLTMSSSVESVTGSVGLCCGEEYSFVWTSGNYPNECGYVFYDINGEEILKKTTGSTAPSAGEFFVYTMNCVVPTCIKPIALAVSEITVNSAKLAWTAGEAGQTDWQIMINDDEDNLIDVTENPYVLTTLEPSNAYSVKVRANCGEEDKSDWSAAVEFRTLCVATVVDADHAFEEGFEDTDFAPACWENVVSGTHAWSRSTSQHHGDGAASAYSGFYGDIYLVMPQLAIAEDASKDVKLSFWSYNTYAGDYDKNSVVLLGESEQELWSPESVSQAWVPDTIDLSSFKGQTIQLAFKYEGDNDHGWYLDDIKVEFVEKGSGTGLSGAGIDGVAIKRIENDQVVIIRNGEKFTIMGVKIQ